ncbi:mannitol dehydrogenase family protein [Alphaproteobacteria bacterium]|nr:mannitol dehydrogenase family protein [Alphaproteobacteria bacterium]
MAVTSKQFPILDLNNEALDQINGSTIKPTYDRSQLQAGIVHIGVGNFHRAHLSWYLHRLMQKGMDLDWAIIGSGVTEYDIPMREKLASQDFLTTLIELDPEGNRSCEIVGSMMDYVAVEKNNQPLIQAMSQPNIRIVSLTVTEGGYFINEKGELILDHPDLVHDIESPDSPRTAFGAMVSALDLRRQAGLGPFTGLSCDNLIENGNKLKQVVLGIATNRNLELANWIEENCTFPNAMVDCIVPRTGEVERNIVKSLGINDLVPVSHENFRQWVIEDKFCAGRPAWEDVGVEFSDNVHGYEDQKIRILNGGHQILANAAELLNIETVRDAMKNPIISGLLEKVEYNDVLPHVSPVPGLTPQDYFTLIAARFANPSIQDTIRRIAFDGSSRHAVFLTPSIRDGISKGISIEGLSLVEALWARMCEGTREDGTTIEPNDPMWSELTSIAKQSKDQPEVWLQQSKIYGVLSQNTHFVNSFSYWLKELYAKGVEQTITQYLNN